MRSSRRVNQGRKGENDEAFHGRRRIAGTRIAASGRAIGRRPPPPPPPPPLSLAIAVRPVSSGA